MFAIGASSLLMSEESRFSRFGSLFFPIILSLVQAFFTPMLFAQSSPVFNGLRDYPVGLSPNSMVVEDFNGDGRPDIATADHGSNTISVLLQNSDGTYQAAVSYPVGNNPSSLQGGDVNGDGKPDLLVINSGRQHHRRLAGQRRWHFSVAPARDGNSCEFTSSDGGRRFQRRWQG
jgi:VCBS repeat protein